MSKVGKALIKIADKVKVSLCKDNEIKAIGPKGELSLKLLKGVTASVVENFVKVEINDKYASPAVYGLSRALLNNIVTGVSCGFEKKLEIIGVGYKAELKGQLLSLSLGYSHSISFLLPEEVTGKVELSQTKSHLLTLYSIDKQLLGFVAAEIKKIRPVEPYKGKGIRIEGEYVRRKAGKSSKK